MPGVSHSFAFRQLSSNMSAEFISTWYRVTDARIHLFSQSSHLFDNQATFPFPDTVNFIVLAKKQTWHSPEFAELR